MSMSDTALLAPDTLPVQAGGAAGPRPTPAPLRPKRPSPPDITLMRLERPFACPTCGKDVRHQACAHVYAPLCPDCQRAHDALARLARRRGEEPADPETERCVHGRAPYEGIAAIPRPKPGERALAQGYQSREPRRFDWWSFKLD